MTKHYLMLYDVNYEPIGFKAIPNTAYHTIAGNLETVPAEYVTHRVVSREEVCKYFELDEDE